MRLSSTLSNHILKNLQQWGLYHIPGEVMWFVIKATCLLSRWKVKLLLHFLPVSILYKGMLPLLPTATPPPPKNSQTQLFPSEFCAAFCATKPLHKTLKYLFMSEFISETKQFWNDRFMFKFYLYSKVGNNIPRNSSMFIMIQWEVTIAKWLTVDFKWSCIKLADIIFL